jgi:hypothetical protein
MDESHYLYNTAPIEVGSEFDGYLRNWPQENWESLSVWDKAFSRLNGLYLHERGGKGG